MNMSIVRDVFIKESSDFTKWNNVSLMIEICINKRLVI